MLVKKRITSRKQRFLLIHIFAFIAVLLTASWSTAQSSRAEVLAEQKAAKAKELHPYEPNKAQRIVQKLENSGFLGGQPRGFYPVLGSAYRTGSFAGGAGYYYGYGDMGSWWLQGLWSIKNYKRAETNWHLSEFADNRIKIDLNAYWLDAPQIPFYGIGPDSSKDNKTNYLLRPYYGGATGTIFPAKYFSFGGGADYGRAETDEGHGSTPSVEEVFPPSQTPGFGETLTYLRSRGFVMFDYRHPAPGYNMGGGMYRAEYLDYSEEDDHPFSFRELDLEAIQLFPILRSNWLIRLRAAAAFTYTDDGNQVPFFLLPNLGGGRELRGFPDFRFMDNNKIILSGEYVWVPSKFLQMYLFFDAGKVEPERSEINLENLETSYGIGARFHGPGNAVGLRIEVAHSDEFTRFNFTFGPAW
jgi:hypothetical protein